MLPIHARLALAAAAVPAVLAQQSLYGQCGGQGWKGATTCVAGSTCVVSNPYYSQCLPGTASSSSSSQCTSTITISSSRSSTTTTFVPTPPPSTSSSRTTTCSSYLCVDYINSCGKTYGGCYSACSGIPRPTFADPGCSSSTSPTKTTSTPSTTTTRTSAPGAGPGATLQPGYYWIRAVEAPNFHQYLATNPQYTTGVGVLSNYTAAGQFQIVDGQLVELISSSATNPTLLYANVGQPATPSSSLLPVTFSTTKNTFGTFSFGGDALQWSAPTVQRQNLAAWYVCAGQQVFINTGAYLYGTPAGCADETIHYYNGATAVS